MSQDTDRMPVRETTTGKVRGVRAIGYDAFFGIPYGSAVDGRCRFARPRPAEPWAGLRDAFAFGAASPQADLRVTATPGQLPLLNLYYPGFGTPLEGRVSSENCLFLNVWAPAGATARPVMVWLHGGAFSGGTGAENWFLGDRLASDENVVVVSLNHRLGLFGFLPSSDELGADRTQSGLAGMFDIVLALEWVAANIEQFGGDPDNVTIFGQSGGGLKVLTLLAMPAAQSLFTRAIVQSIPGIRLIGHEESERTLFLSLIHI